MYVVHIDFILNGLDNQEDQSFTHVLPNLSRNTCQGLGLVGCTIRNVSFHIKPIFFYYNLSVDLKLSEFPSLMVILVTLYLPQRLR